MGIWSFYFIMNCMSCIQHRADLVYYFSRQHFKRKIKLVGKKCNSYRIRPQSCDFCFWASIERSFLFWFYWKQQKVLSSFNVLSWARQHLVWASCFWFWLCSWHCKLCIIFLIGNEIKIKVYRVASTNADFIVLSVSKTEFFCNVNVLGVHNRVYIRWLSLTLKLTNIC